MVSESGDPPRRYDSALRQERARRTREHVVATAEKLFAEHGYAGTSMRRIAADAGVSLETVTQTGRKADLLLAAFRDSFAGSPGATDLSPLVGTAPADGSTDLTRLAHAAVERLAVGLRRSLGIWRAFTVAATVDPAVAAVRAESVVARRREITGWLEASESGGLLPERDPGSRERLADAVGLLLSHESYDHLTELCGWPHEQYVTWAVSTLLSQLGTSSDAASGTTDRAAGHGPRR